MAKKTQDKTAKTAKATPSKEAKGAKATTPAKTAKTAKAPKQTTVIRTAHIVGREEPKRPGRGNFVFQVGKTYAVQAIATNEVTELPGKVNAAAKALLTVGGVVTKATAKTAGLDFAELVAKVNGAKKAHVTATASKLTVTPHASRDNLTTADEPAAKEAKPAKAKATKEAAKPAKAKAAKEAKEAKSAKADKKPAKEAKADKKSAKKAKKSK